jgi:hypothetical protein
VKSIAAFKGKVHDGALFDFVSAVFPAESDMHQEVEAEEAFPAFRRSPDYG